MESKDESEIEETEEILSAKGCLTKERHVFPLSMAISSLNNVITCPRCNGIAQTPQTVKGCKARKECSKRVYCLYCIITYHETNPNCCPYPSCTTNNIRYEISDFAADMIEDGEYKCLYHEKSCSFQGQLSQIIKHLNEDCQYEVIPCKGCKQKIERTNIKSHIKHCPQYPRKCKDCKNTFQQKEFNKHKKICPERLISCPFEDSNCTVKKMKAKDLQTHKEEQYLDHLDLAHEQLFNYVRMLQKDVHDLKQEKTLLESRLQKLELEFFRMKRMEEIKKESDFEILTTTDADTRKSDPEEAKVYTESIIPITRKTGKFDDDW